MNALSVLQGGTFTCGDLVDALSETEAWAHTFAKAKGGDEAARKKVRAASIGYTLKKFRLKGKSTSRGTEYDRIEVMKIIKAHLPDNLQDLANLPQPQTESPQPAAQESTCEPGLPLEGSPDTMQGAADESATPATQPPGRNGSSRGFSTLLEGQNPDLPGPQVFSDKGQVEGVEGLEGSQSPKPSNGNVPANVPDCHPAAIRGSQEHLLNGVSLMNDAGTHQMPDPHISPTQADRSNGKGNKPWTDGLICPGCKGKWSNPENLKSHLKTCTAFDHGAMVLTRARLQAGTSTDPALLARYLQYEALGIGLLI